MREGDRVISDQPLVTLDERDFLPQLDQARADVAELEAQLRSEDARYQSDLEAQKQEQKLLALYRGGVDRARRLQKKQLGSDSALDQAEQELARQSLAVTSRALAIADHPARRSALEARLRRAHARQDEIALDYERSRVRAPYAGIVAQVTAALAEAGFNILDLESDVAGTAERPVYIMQIAGVADVPVETIERALEPLREDGVDVNVSAIETYIG